MFKFINSDGQEITYEELVSEIDQNTSPIKEIIAKKDFSSFSISFNEQTYSLEETFLLQVNVKDIGVFCFIFNKEGFKKDEIINQISVLKERVVVDTQSAKEKVLSLLSIVNIPCLLFAIYQANDITYINNEYLKTFISLNVQTFLIKKEKKNEVFELNVGEEKSQEPKKEKKTNKKSINQFFKIIADEKFHYLLLLISTTLFEVSIPLAIANIYEANLIYIFLFICAVIGIGMDGYSYYDLFKTERPFSLASLASYLFNLIGIGTGIGLFALFYNMSNLTEAVPPLGSMVLIGISICFILCVAVVIVSLFIPKKNKKVNNEE